MEENLKYGWHIEVVDNGAFLLGANINSNHHYSEKRESYLCVYLGKWTICIGKFYK